MITVEQAIQEYLNDLAVGQSRQTVATYSEGLTRFREFLGSVDHSPATDASMLSVDDALGFAKWLAQGRENQDARIGKATLRTYLSSVSRFYAYLLRERIVELAAADLERMRDAFHNYRRGYNRPLPKLPSDDAVSALLAAAREVKAEPKKPRLELARLRNIAMLEALRSSGMRVGELVGLRRDHLDYRMHSARVTGKGDKQRIVYFDDAAWAAIESYLKARADGAKGRALYQLPVFARHDRRAGDQTLPLTTDSVRLVFNQLAEAAEIQGSMTPHSLRHAFATRMLDVTSDLALVQDMLGHASPDTTRIYAKVSDKKIRKAHKEAFGYRDSGREE